MRFDARSIERCDSIDERCMGDSRLVSDFVRLFASIYARVFIERKMEVCTPNVGMSRHTRLSIASWWRGDGMLKTPDEGGRSTYGSEIPCLKEVRRASEHD